MPHTANQLQDRLLRRWYLVIVGVFVTIGLCIAGVFLVPAKYQAQANVLIVPPSTRLAPNPFVSLAGTQPFADVEARALTSSSMAAKLRQGGFGGSYTVIRDQTTDAPVVIITADDSSAAGAISGLDAIINAAEPTLQALQTTGSSTPIPAVSQARAEVVTRPKHATRVLKSLIRTLVVAVVVGLVGTVMITSLVDGMLPSRRRVGSPAEDDDDRPMPEPVVSRPEAVAVHNGELATAAEVPFAETIDSRLESLTPHGKRAGLRRS